VKKLFYDNLQSALMNQGQKKPCQTKTFMLL